MSGEIEIPVLDKGYVRYIDHLGSDLRAVEAARISYKSPSKGDEADKKLLFYLYKCGHSSCFEQNSITFNIKLPLFVMGQLVRHRMARLNSLSFRYTNPTDDFYIPQKWRKQDTKNKQGSLEDDQWEPKIIHDSFNHHGHEDVSTCVSDHCAKSYELYMELVRSGVAREMARIVLPQNLYTEIYWNSDLNNLMKFFRLRLDVHAQFEMQIYARAMFAIFEQKFPWCAEAYRKYQFKIVEEGSA